MMRTRESGLAVLERLDDTMLNSLVYHIIRYII